MLFFIVTSTVQAGSPPADSFEEHCLKLLTDPHTRKDAARLHALLDLAWKRRLVSSPEMATYVGVPGQNDRWSDSSPAGLEQERKEAKVQLRVLQRIARTKLSAADRLNYDLFKRGLDEFFAEDRFHARVLVIDPLSGPDLSLEQIFELSPVSNIQDFEDRISRLASFPVVLQQMQDLMKEGIKRGITPPKALLTDIPERIQKQLDPDPDKNPILESFNKMPQSIPEPERNRVKKKAVQVLVEKTLPALKNFHDFLVKTYIPGCRSTIAWKDVPNGKAWYTFLIQHHADSDLSPEKIHEIGLAEVKRIKAEMLQVIASTGFKGDLAAFNHFLKTDPQFHFEKQQDLLNAYQSISQKVDPRLKELFGKLPSLAYEVKPVPSYAEKSQPSGYYYRGSVLTKRAGIFYANTYNLKSRPKWEMETLFAHEAVPGHHFQISIAMELKDLPEFRKHNEYTAFVEGWGLYAESLGKELGLYQDPYSYMGRLNYEMWRSVRLVVDTGIHALGWSRDQAIQFFHENAANSDHDTEVEVNRYIVWPGQALAYKTGELKFKELRKYAQKELGSKFDIRKFHDVLLENGAVPLPIAEAQVKDWVRVQRSL